MKWVIGIVVLLVVVCGGLCAAGGGYFYWMTRGGTELALPDYGQQADPTEAAATPASGSGAIGVESCDAYIERMTACLSTMDATTKAATEASFIQTADAWRAAATTPEGKAALEMGCKAALDSIPASCSSGAASTPTDATTAPADPGAAGTGAAGTGAAPTDAKQGDPIAPPPGSGTPPAAAGTKPATSTQPASTPAATKPAASTPPAATKAGTSTTPAATTKPTTSTTPAAKPGTTTTPPSTSTTAKPSASRPSTSDDDPITPPAASGDSKVAIGFVLPSGGKWDDLVVGVDGSSLGKRPLRTRVTPGSHTFTFKTEGLDLSCPIDVGSSGRTIILDQKKKSCPSKSG